MPTYVIDANVAIGWTIALPYSNACNRLLQESSALIAPDLIIAEVTNAFFQQAKTGLAERDRLLDGLELLPRWFSELVPTATLRTQAFDLAFQLEHPAYDCYYLALALSRDVKFVSADNHFLRKATAKGYEKSVMSLDGW